jgi:hypothetical protein
MQRHTGLEETGAGFMTQIMEVEVNGAQLLARAGIQLPVGGPRRLVPVGPKHAGFPGFVDAFHRFAE